MRVFIAALLGVALTAGLWSSGPGWAVAGGRNDVQGQAQNCQPGPAFVPGSSVGPIAIGTALDVVQRRLGRPQAVEGRVAQGHRWTRLVYPGLNVLGMDDAVIALTIPQGAWVPVQTSCGTIVSQPLSLPVGNLMQAYGVPPAAVVNNGLQYLLYNGRGLLVTLPAGGSVVQGLTVYRAGQYCTVVPRLVSFGWFTVQAGNVLNCAIEEQAGREHEGPVH